MEREVDIRNLIVDISNGRRRSKRDGYVPSIRESPPGLGEILPFNFSICMQSKFGVLGTFFDSLADIDPTLDIGPLLIAPLV